MQLLWLTHYVMHDIQIIINDAARVVKGISLGLVLPRFSKIYTEVCFHNLVIIYNTIIVNTSKYRHKLVAITMVIIFFYHVVNMHQY